MRVCPFPRVADGARKCLSELDDRGEMARLSAGWKSRILESLHFVFNRRKISRYFFFLSCELANAKSPARLRETIVNYDRVQFQFLVTLRRVEEDELLLG